MKKKEKELVEKQKVVEWKEEIEYKNKIVMFKNECKKVNVLQVFYYCNLDLDFCNCVCLMLKQFYKMYIIFELICNILF